MIFYIYGTNDYLCREKLKELKTSFINKKDQMGFNVVHLNAEDLNYDRFTQEVLTIPFLSEKKLIIISNLIAENSGNIKKIKEQIFDFIKNKEKNIENNLLFIDVFEEIKKIPLKDSLFNYLKKQQYVWECHTPKGQQLTNWVNKYCQTKKIKINQQAINELINLIGDELNQITLELSKLTAYKNGKMITAEDVKILVKAKFDDNIFKLTDALASRNKTLALKLITHQLLANEQPLSLLAKIASQFKTLLKIKAELTNNPQATVKSLVDKFGFHPYVVQKNLNNVKNFSLEQLITINNQFIEIEKQLKLGTKNPELLFNLLIIKNC